MKKRSMILALASMLGISAAATAVSGFAWFTTQTTASIATQTYVVGAAEGSLLIDTVANSNINTSAYSVTNNTATITPASGVLADESSADGEAFAKAKFQAAATATLDSIVSEGSADATTHKWMSTVNATQMVCVQWQLTVTNQGDTNTKMNVLVSKAGTLFSNTTGSYANAYRLAIYNVSDSKLVYLYSGIGDTDTNNKYAKAGDTELRKNDLGDHDYGTVLAFTKSSDTGYATETASDDPDTQCIVKDLVGQSSKTFKFTVWCEGTATSEAAVEANEVTMDFQLVGINSANA